MRRAVALMTAVLVAGLLATAAVPVLADDHPDTSGITGVDARPECGVAGAGLPATLASGEAPVVGTYNVLHSQGEDDDADVSDRFDQVVDALVTGEADVYGLQEVTKDSEHGHVAELVAQALAETTGERWEWCWVLSNPHFPGTPDVNEGGGNPVDDLMAEFSKFPEDGDFRVGEAIVTRLDITRARARRYQQRSYEAALCVPPDPIGCNLAAVFDSRQLLWGRIDAGDAGEFDMFTTHIAHHLTEASPATKRVQINLALRYIDEWAAPDALPDYFVGDFNTMPGEPRFQDVLDAGFHDTYADTGATECGQHPRHAWQGCTSSQQVLTDGTPPTPTVTRRIDHVFARPGTCGLSSEAAQIIGTNAEKIDPPHDTRWRWPSDHLGVVTRTTCA